VSDDCRAAIERTILVSGDPLISIRTEEPSMAQAVDAFYASMFGPGRFAKTAERLREGNRPIAGASLVAEDADGLVGVVRLWPVCVGDSGQAAFLGPLAVHPRRRGGALSFSLMERSIGVCRELGFPAVILVGDEGYYERFGFRRAGRGRFSLPGPVDPDRILIRDLSGDAGALAGALSVPRDARQA
jgi:predicted N-acetyltransferase YhbS